VFYPAPCRAPIASGGAQQTIDALATGFSLALSMAQARARAVRLGEQLAEASQALAAAQDVLAEAKTLAAVGEMAAGAAHELNTPLAVISGRAQLMQQKADRPEDGATWQLIADQAQRVSDILSGLMELASPRQPAPEAFDVGELLAQAAESFRSSEHAKAPDARVDIEVEPGVPPAWADRRQIRMVIEELLANAATAAGTAPKIRLSAEADEPNDAVLLTVRDNGPGMDQRTLASAFTPFFSSQRAGRRRGLGLPRAKRYVESNGGRIWIRTQPGEGTTVCVQLPRARS
jgi:signal transduction histidine kinase